MEVGYHGVNCPKSVAGEDIDLGFPSHCRELHAPVLVNVLGRLFQNTDRCRSNCDNASPFLLRSVQSSSSCLVYLKLLTVYLVQAGVFCFHGPKGVQAYMQRHKDCFYTGVSYLL